MAKLTESAMLVHVRISAFSQTKTDKKIAQEMQDARGITGDSLQAQKRLVSKHLIANVTTRLGAIRSFVYSMTLPWLDTEGLRLLAGKSFMEFDATLIKLMDDLERAVSELETHWPAVIQDAKVRFNGDFNPADYPDSIRDKYKVSVRYSPIASSNDIRVQCGDSDDSTLRDKLAKDLEATYEEAAKVATAKLCERVLEPVAHMAERLNAYTRNDIANAKGRKVEGGFRDSLVENLKEMVASIQRLNLSNDSRVEALRQRIESDLCAFDPETLREDADIRKETADKAAKIAKDIQDVMSEFI